MTKIELIESLNKLSQDNSYLNKERLRLETEIASLISQLDWHKQTNKTLLETMWAGAREGKFPRS